MTYPETITSAANPLVKRIRALADRRGRRRAGAFLVEGVQPVWRAVEAGWEIEALLVVPGRLADPAAAMVAAQRVAGARVVELAEHLAGRLAERDTPPGLLAVVRAREWPAPEAGPRDVFLALHRVGNPGNLGTVVRTADAAGAAGVLLVGETADQYAPAAVKASMGSMFALPVHRMPDLTALFDWARAGGAQVVASSGYATTAHWSRGYRTPLVLLLGSEGDGLPEEALERADGTVAVPMTGTAESLNLAVAAALLLYEARRPPAGEWNNVRAGPGP
jgi:TrmH family RNA methyltransferase